MSQDDPALYEMREADPRLSKRSSKVNRACLDQLRCLSPTAR